MSERILGVIGGSGLYDLPGIREVQPVRLSTPFGEPSDELMRGRLGDVQVVFLPRHGKGHRLLPSEIPFRANVFAMKTLGVEWLLSIGTVGSLREQLVPGHVVVPDQFIDRTHQRPLSFFGDGVVAHVGIADPYCSVLSRLLAEAGESLMPAGRELHRGGTYLCMEGPQFSTQAESYLYRAWGMDVIGMTNLQEAKLAREAEMCYATLALVTDYDCWHPEHDHVRIEDVLAVMHQNSDHAQRALAAAVAAPPPAGCACQRALENAVMTRRDAWPEAAYHKLRPLLQRLVEPKEEMA